MINDIICAATVGQVFYYLTVKAFLIAKCK